MSSPIRWLSPNGEDQGKCAQNSPCRTIDFASNLPGEPEIRLARGIYTGATISKNTVIRGTDSGAVIDGDGSQVLRFIASKPFAVHLKRITIQNGTSLQICGGGIFGKNVFIEIENTEILSNAANEGGGGCFED